MFEMARDVIIIGGGLSGLSAAKLLRLSGLDVQVLEARDQIGGRIYTKKSQKITYVDLGGAYVGPGQDRVLRMIKQLGLQIYKVNEEEDIVHLDMRTVRPESERNVGGVSATRFQVLVAVGGVLEHLHHSLVGYCRVARMSPTCLESIADGFGPVAIRQRGKRTRFRSNRNPSIGGLYGGLDINNIFRVMDKMGEEIPADKPWNASKAQEWDQMTFQEFLEMNTWTKTTRAFVTSFFNAMVTSEPYESSLLWALWYIKQCGGSRSAYAVTGGEMERKIIGGSQQICEQLAKCLGEESVLINKAVVGITQTDDEVVVKCLDNSNYTARYVIMALPPALQNKIHYSPALPPLRNQLNQRCPMGSVIKIIVYYKTCFWRERGFCGIIMIDGLLDAPVPLTLDDTKPDGTEPAIVGFITGNKARHLQQLTKEERLRRITQSFAKAFDTSEALREHNWSAEQYSGGAYTTMCPPGFLTTFGKVIRQPIGRMYFAGTETATKWSGYMDGAIQAGERAAREVLVDMRRLNEDQVWQEEPESLDVPHYHFETTFWERSQPSVDAIVKLFLGLVVVLILKFIF